MKQLWIFKSQSCAPCKALSTMLKDTNLKVDQITTIDTSMGKEIFMEYNVRTVPTSIIIEDGKEVSRYVGYTLKDAYLAFINGEIVRTT